MGIIGNRLWYPFTKIKNGGLGELEQALGATAPDKSHIKLFTQVTPIKWAKYQPFISGTVYSDRYFASTGSAANPNSARYQGLKAANFGWGTSGIPSYSNWSTLRAALVAGITPGSVWTRERPDGQNNRLLRAMDFDGYAITAWRTSYGTSSRATELYFPFDGYVQVTDRNSFGPYDSVKTAILEPEGPDGDDGLLYLSDFASMGTGLYNYNNWYFGLLLVPNSVTSSSASTVAYLVNSAKSIQEAINDDDWPQMNDIPSPFTMGDGKVGVAYQIYPVLTSKKYAVRFTAISGWSDENSGPGRMVLIDGYRMGISVNNDAAANQGKGFLINPTVTVGSTTTTISVNVQNKTSSNITVSANQFYMYYTAEKVFDSSDGLYDNVTTAIQNWIDGVTSTPTDVSYNNKVISRLVSLYSAFYSASGTGKSANSNVISSNGNVTFSVQINAIKDGMDNTYVGPWDVQDFFYGATINGTYRKQRS